MLRLLTIFSARFFRSRCDLLLENLALRQQLAALKGRCPQVRLAVTYKWFRVMLRRHWHGWRAPAAAATRSNVEPQSPARLLPLRNLQPFVTPDALHPVLASPPAVPLQQRRDPEISIASILAGQLHDGLGECILVFALGQLIALRAPCWFTNRHARRSLMPCSCA